MPTKPKTFKPRENTRARQYQAGPDKRPSAAQRGYDSKWSKLSREIREARPVCERCGLQPSKAVHHIIPKAQGGPDEPDNLIALCAACHNKVEKGKP